ncbi:MAG: hypothetical protein WC389_19885 [Lutibacter sp.]|jgi:hypothetical protein
MTGQFQVWNTKENRPATVKEISCLIDECRLYFSYSDFKNGGLVYPKLTYSETDFEIREVKE